jgi:hypothetical protein
VANWRSETAALALALAVALAVAVALAAGTIHCRQGCHGAVVVSGQETEPGIQVSLTGGLCMYYSFPPIQY